MFVKAFRLFVSSTFADFAQERDVLQNEVFPAIDIYCTEKGYQFYPIDLRWGVSEEAQLDQRTVEICLSELRAAKSYPPPNFLIMIGDRYGWIPLPFSIARDEFEAIADWIKGQGWRDAARAIDSCYEHDENHLVPRDLSEAGPDGHPFNSAYTLRSREDELPDLKPAQAWEKLEAKLRHALQAAADGLLTLGRIGTAAHVKYFISLTEQEIVDGLPGCQPAIDATSALSKGTVRLKANSGIKEVIHGPLATRLGVYSASPPSPGTSVPAAIAFIRGIEGGSTQATPGFFEAEPRLEALKKAIKHTLSEGGIFSASAACDKSGKLDGVYLSEFGAQIESRLKSAIDVHIARVEAIERTPGFALESERAAHRAFAASKLKIFVGRENNLAAIDDFLSDAGNLPLVVHGRSGFGKSALMSRAIGAAEAAKGAPVISRFIGASAASSNLRSLLISLIDDLAGYDIVSKPRKFEHDTKRFNAQIELLLLSIGKPVVVFLDALDQLSHPHGLGWLPRALPDELKLVLSVLDDKAYETDSGFYHNLRARLPPRAFLEIEPLVPAQGREILSALEEQAQRGLRHDQRDYIIKKFEAAGGSPLYLRTAFEIAKGWKSTAKAGIGRHTLAEGTTGIIAHFMSELSSVHYHQPELVTCSLGYLSAAKDGLSEKELTEVLSRDEGVMRSISAEKHDARTKKLPPSVWVRLNRDLSPFLVEKLIDDRPLLQFFHRQVAQVARERHYEPVKTGLHASLAAYFLSQATEQDGGRRYGKRSLSELPYQFHGAGQTRQLDEILESPDWIQQKFSAFGSQALVSDYEQFGRNEFHDDIGHSLRLITGICARDNQQLLSQLHGRLLSQDGAASFCSEALQLLKRPAIVTARLSLTPPGTEIIRLEGHSAMLVTLASLPDGRLASGSNDRTIRIWDPKKGAEVARLDGHHAVVVALAVLPDGRLASGSGDKTIRFWDTRSYAELARFRDQAGGVSALAVMSDGRLASGSYDGTIALWDLNAGTELGRLRGHNGYVGALALLPDGRLASASDDKTIRLWDVNRGAETARLAGHDGWVRALAVLPDGRLASASYDNTIRLWDPRSGAELARLDGHESIVMALVSLPDGSLASASDDRTIRLWDPDRGAELARFEGHDGWVRALAVLPDGRLASGSEDNTVRLWNLKRGTKTTQLEGHRGWVRALALLPDGRLVSAGSDGTIRLWDPDSSAELARLDGHGDWVQALTVMPDGRLASGSQDLTIRIWDPNNGTELARFENAGDSVRYLVALPDGRLASTSYNDTIRLWDPGSGAEVARLEGRGALAVMNDGRLASTSYDNAIVFWDSNSGVELTRLEGHSDSVWALAVLPDGRLASASYDNTIRLWDLSSGAETVRLDGHADAVTALAPLPDMRLVSGSNDRTIRLWDPIKCTELSRIEVDAEVKCLIALANGILVAGDALGRLHWLKILD